MKNHLKTLLVAASVATLASAASAQITYVDATDTAAGNTAIAASSGGGVFTGLAAQGPGGDTAWDKRVFGNGATIYQNAQSGNTDNAVRLATSTPLANGTYFVYAYFWSDTSSWGMQAGLTDPGAGVNMKGNQFNPNTPGTTQWYTGADATVLSTALASNPFSTGVMVADGNRRLIQINLGQTTVSGGILTLFIDDRTITENFAADGNPILAALDQNHRTWFDGIGYSTTQIPEPSSMALLGLGALVVTFVIRRRNS